MKIRINTESPDYFGSLSHFRYIWCSSRPSVSLGVRLFVKRLRLARDSCFPTAALLFASPVGAGQNLRQLDTGGAEWVRPGSDNAEVTAPVGAVYFYIPIANIASEATYAIVSPITDARVSLIQISLGDTITGTDTVFDMYIVGSGNGHPITPGIGTTFQLGPHREISGTYFGATQQTTSLRRLTFDIPASGLDGLPAPATASFTPLNATASFLQRGNVILIHNNGASTASATFPAKEIRSRAGITITIVPRGN